MKRLYLVGGTMGVGKTTVCQCLKRQLPRAVFLDGDWCWDADPFVVTDETKAMVMGNITHLLGSFLRCTAYENVIFCWVLHEQPILEEILARLPLDGVEVKAVSLVSTPAALEARLRADIAAGLRRPDVLPRSLVRLPLYAALPTAKLDVTDLTPAQAADRLARL